MSKVFIVNEPLRREDGRMVQYLDLTLVEEYGSIVDLLPPGRIMPDMVKVIRQISEGLKLWEPGDILLPLGDLTACVVAASILSRLSGGKYKLLRWHRSESQYSIVDVDLGFGAELPRPKGLHELPL